MGFDPTAARSTMTRHDRIEMNPKIMLGKPVIRGSRITVELILRKIAEGPTRRRFCRLIRSSRVKTSAPRSVTLRDLTGCGEALAVWWVVQGSNLWPPPCEGDALPLS